MGRRDAEFWRHRAARLQVVLDARVVIEQAKGMLAERYGIQIEQAFTLLRRTARSSGVSVHVLAARTVSSGRTPPEIRKLVEEGRVFVRGRQLDVLIDALYAGRFGRSGAVAVAARAARAAPGQVGAQTPGDLLLDGFALLSVRGHRAAAPTLRRAIERLDGETELGWLRLGCQAAIELWDDDALYELTTQSLRLARDRGEASPIAAALHYYGGAYEIAVGNLDRAERCLREAAALGDADGEKANGSKLGLLLAAAWRGNDESIRVRAASSINDARERGQGAEVNAAYYSMSVLENGRGQYPRAVASARQASKHGWFAVSAWALPELVEAASRSNRMDLAAQAVQRLADTVLPSGTDWGRGMLARSQALTAVDSDAEPHYREALERLERCRALPQFARGKLLYGEWLRRRGRRRDAREQLREAHKILSSLGINAYADRAAIELIATGERVRRRTTQSRDGLTPREEHVARLAQDGASNSEVAVQLFISPRTVEYHLHKIFRKLGITSRVHLARALDKEARTPAGRDEIE
jgi:DNA-binding CsgD family transcriptional regulator